MDPIPESLGARQPVEESNAPSTGLGGDERLASTVDGSVAAPKAMAGTAGSLEAEASYRCHVEIWSGEACSAEGADGAP